MPSLQITITPEKRAAARFIGTVRRAIQKAYIEEQRKRNLSQSDIARELHVHRSVINRELRGFKDMTLGRVGQFAWALGRRPNFSLDEQIAAIGQNIAPVEPPKITSVSTTTTNTKTINYSLPKIPAAA
jgi:Helix-turn-helix domain